MHKIQTRTSTFFNLGEPRSRVTQKEPRSNISGCMTSSAVLEGASFSSSVSWSTKMAGLTREDVVNLSTAEELAAKLEEAGLPKTLTTALEGKDFSNFLP